MLDGAVVAFLICLQHFQWSERVICMQQFSLWPEAKYCLLNACDCFIRPRRVFSSPLQGTISVNGLSLLLLWSCRQQAAGLHTMFKHCHHGRVRLLFCCGRKVGHEIGLTLLRRQATCYQTHVTLLGQEFDFPEGFNWLLWFLSLF